MISQIPPNDPESPTRGTRVGRVRRASDLVKDHDRRVELRGFEPLTPSMRTRRATGQTGRVTGSAQVRDLHKLTITASEAA